MRKKYVIIVSLLILVGLQLFLNTRNFSLGSNTFSFKTVLDYPYTVWTCKKNNATITVFDSKAILEIEENKKIKKFAVHILGDHFDLFRIDESNQEIKDIKPEDNINVIFANSKYHKNILGKITSFEITISKDNQSIDGFRTLKFFKRDSWNIIRQGDSSRPLKNTRGTVLLYKSKGE